MLPQDEIEALEKTAKEQIANFVVRRYKLPDEYRVTIKAKISSLTPSVVAKDFMLEKCHLDFTPGYRDFDFIMRMTAAI
ncbi:MULTISPECIES: hypothetical protein [unclassified Pseudomonas]|uniref:hypothetical protein n=1 Tax=unclassified Pseudomonas TaxID=196821 RepID=UPI001476516C|nr:MULTISPECIES: hypothetical protein [unclassified Pseudomonas]NMY36196.1 hypothetical protein [Pseudomonas sp. WS 5078]NMY58937.1 hypothetical protein [Pseudomonas sp. WS 5354]